MPIRRKTFRKRRSTKRPSRRRHFGSRPSGLRSQLARIGISAPTHKYLDYTDYLTLGTPSITAASSSSPFNNPYSYYGVQVIRIAAGDGPNNRNNNTIYLKNFRARMSLQAINDLTAEVYTPPYQVRIMIVLDTQQASDDLGVTPSEVLASTATDWACMVSFRNIDSYKGRFKVMYDKTVRFSAQTTAFIMDSETTSVDVTQAYGLKDINLRLTKTFPGRGLPITYNGSGATDIQKNGIYWLMFTDNQLAATNPTAVSLNVRQTFVENI